MSVLTGAELTKGGSLVHNAYTAVCRHIAVQHNLEGALLLEGCKVGEQRLVGEALEGRPLELGDDLQGERERGSRGTHG